MVDIGHNFLDSEMRAAVVEGWVRLSEWSMNHGRYLELTNTGRRVLAEMLAGGSVVDAEGSNPPPGSRSEGQETLEAPGASEASEAFRRRCVEAAEAAYAKWVPTNLENLRDKRSPGERFADAVLAVRDDELATAREAFKITRGQLKETRKHYQELVSEMLDWRRRAEEAEARLDGQAWDDLAARAKRSDAILARVREFAAEMAALAPPDEWGLTPAHTTKADMGRFILAILDGPDEDLPAVRQDAETLHEKALRDVPHVAADQVEAAVETWHERSSEGYPLDDVLRYVLGPLAATVADYENGLNWHTTCTGCARLLDKLYAADMAREQAEAAVVRVRALHQPTEGMGSNCGEDPTPGSYGRIAQVCTSCGTSGEHGVRWPCPTIQALDADDEPAPIRFGEQENDRG
jgi:hypothetical protein